mmetsp:Transcript_23135/g.57540  ORF Transcript_23135/g.57540 Transcript_23135/m.57540 type:complete len:281 (+) Transcript_23135:208-1050(+)
MLSQRWWQHVAMHSEAQAVPRPRRERRAMSVAPPHKCFAHASSRSGGHCDACNAAAAFHNSSKRSAGPICPEPLQLLLAACKASPAKSAARGSGRPETHSGSPATSAARSKSAISKRRRSTASERFSCRFSILCLRASRSTSTQRRPGRRASTAAARPARPQPYSTMRASCSSRPRSMISSVNAAFWASCFSAWATLPAVATTERCKSSSASTLAPKTCSTALGKAAANLSKSPASASSPLLASADEASSVVAAAGGSLASARSPCSAEQQPPLQLTPFL